MMGIRDEIAEKYCNYAWGWTLETLKEIGGQQEVDDCHTVACEIISLIESKLPMVEEECRKCAGTGEIIVNRYPRLCIATDCKSGQTTRSMTLEESIEWIPKAIYTINHLKAQIEKLRGKG